MKGPPPEHAAGLKLIAGARTRGQAHVGRRGRGDLAAALGSSKRARRGVDYRNPRNWGTVYFGGLRSWAVVEVAHEHGLAVHVDGARLANAAVSLQTSMGCFDHRNSGWT